MPHFNQVTIIGCGLLGASFGLALKQAGLAARIVGVGRKQATLDRAQELGAIDASAPLEEAVAQSDLILLAVPVAQSVEILSVIAGIARADAIITDVGSTKAAICERADTLWPSNRRFIGSHPMAGSEKFGPDHARGDLYEEAVVLIESADTLDPQARQAVVDLWEALGARVLSIEPHEHDEILAYTSHLPHVAAACIAANVADDEHVSAMAGKGFRDTTRVAASRPEVWTEICLTNKDAMISGLRAYEAWLAGFRAALEADDAAAVEAYFDEGRAARERIFGQ